jgi:hypothetical protein
MDLLAGASQVQALTGYSLHYQPCASHLQPGAVVCCGLPLMRFLQRAGARRLMPGDSASLDCHRHGVGRLFIDR